MLLDDDASPRSSITVGPEDPLLPTTQPSLPLETVTSSSSPVLSYVPTSTFVSTPTVVPRPTLTLTFTTIPQAAPSSSPTAIAATPEVTLTGIPAEPTHLKVAFVQFVNWEEGPDYLHPATLQVFSGVDQDAEFVPAGDDTSYYDPVWSPDGGWLAYIKRQGDETMSVHLYSSDWQHHFRLSQDFDFGQLHLWTDYLDIETWSSDSSWLYFRYSQGTGITSTAYLVNREIGNVQMVGRNVTSLAWSEREPERLAFATTPTGGIYRASVYTARVDNLDDAACLVCGESELRAKRVCSMAWSPDGQRLALSVTKDCINYWVGSREMWVLDANRGELQARINIPHASDLTWSKDGRWLALYDMEQVTIYNTTDWSVIRTVEVSPLSGNDPKTKWTDAGELIYLQWNGKDEKLWVLPMPDGEPHLLWEPSMVGLGEEQIGFVDWYQGQQSRGK